MLALASAHRQPGIGAAQQRRRRSPPAPLPPHVPLGQLASARSSASQCPWRACQPGLSSGQQRVASRQAAASDASTAAAADADAEDDPATAFDWGVALALAGCAFEAYNEVEEEGQEGAADGAVDGAPASLKMRALGGTATTFVDRCARAASLTCSVCCRCALCASTLDAA